MPISHGLEKLHVYGDLLKLYDLPAQGTILEAGKLYSEIQVLESRILTLYASYVLARSGFYIEDFADEDIGLEPLFTTKFKDDDWVENLDLFVPNAGSAPETGFEFDWELYYKNEQQERLKLIFTTLFIVEMGPGGVPLDEVSYFLKKFDASCANYVVVHPRLSRQDKPSFMDLKEKMKQKTGKDLILSTGELVAKFISNDDKRNVTEENWASLREKIVQNLQKKRNILIFAAYAQQFSDVSERIRQARMKYEIHYYEDAIKDAGIACESLLQILYSLYISKKREEEIELYDLMCTLRETLIEKFGNDLYQDLDFIRIWRNNVVHPREEKPNGEDALKVIAKAELFHELFRRKIFERNLQT